MCKGGGGGGNSADEKAEKGPELVPSKQKVIDIAFLLDKNDGWDWSAEGDLEYCFDDLLDNVSISLNLGTGELQFKGPSALSVKEQEQLDNLYNKIEQELGKFKSELAAQNIDTDASISRDGNTLTINIPNQHQFDVFMVRLMNVDLLPANKSHLAAIEDNASNAQTTAAENQGQNYESPTPFDIGKGPTPTGDG